jgi:hypothetical protein
MTAPLIRNVVLVGLFLVAALVLGRYIAPTTYPLADYHTYVDASHSLYAQGNPYLANEDKGLEFQYRYPPLLAMMMPVLRWIWFPLLGVASVVPLVLRYRASGPEGLLLPIQIAPAWISTVLNGNAQGLTIGMTALAPVWVGSGAVLVAFATWVKLYPICVVVWWLGQRNWTALRWFGLAFIGLGLLQLPWLHDFIAYSRDQVSLPSQSSLRSLGTIPWLGAIAILTYLTYTRAWRDRSTGNDHGWFYCILLQIAVLPRFQVSNLPLLLMHPTLFAAPYATLTNGLRHPLRALTLIAAVVVGVFVLFVVIARNP